MKSITYYLQLQENNAHFSHQDIIHYNGLIVPPTWNNQQSLDETMT